MSYKPYEHYKDSGVQWIGKVPKHWELKKISSIFEQRNEKVSDKDFEPLSVTKMGILKQLENVAKTDNNDNRKKVLKNDFAINSRSDRKGSCGVSQFDGSVSLICTVIKPKTINTYMDYYHHLFRNKMFSEEFYRWGRGIVDDLWSTKWDEFKRILIPIPPHEEQKSIASYLNHIYEAIEELITHKQQQIETIQQYQRSLITEAVTSGLNPHAKMKDSSVEWIGEMPEHWITKRLDFVSIVKARLGWKGLTASEYQENGYIFLAIPNIKKFQIDFENVNYISEKRYKESPEIMLQVGDVLLAKDGSTLGEVNVVRYLPSSATVNSSIAVIRPKGDLHSVFLYYYLKSNYIQKIIQKKKDGMGVPHLFQKDINKFIIQVPPLDEQVRIAKYLDGKISEINNLIMETQEQIDILQQYRQSLIYEVVTGKIDVRSYTGREQEADL